MRETSAARFTLSITICNILMISCWASPYISQNETSVRIRRDTCRFKCLSGECLGIDKFKCDGVKDCADGSDESAEACKAFCPGFAFRCAYGACIHEDGRCDGVAQCADSSDESPDICGSSKPIVTPAPTTPPPATPTEKCVLPPYPKRGKYTVAGCEEGKCPPPGTKLQFAFLNYTCNPGYTITGTHIVYCQEGTWYSPAPTCSEAPRPEPSDPCNPSPCGPNSICLEMISQAVCSCQPSYIGSPPGCRPECVVSSECPENKPCINQKCTDPQDRVY